METVTKIRIPKTLNGSLHLIKNVYERRKEPVIIGKDVPWRQVIEKSLQMLIWCQVWKKNGVWLYVTFKNRRDSVRKKSILDQVIEENTYLGKTIADIEFGDQVINFNKAGFEEIFGALMKDFNLPSEYQVIWLSLALCAKILLYQVSEGKNLYLLKSWLDKRTPCRRILDGELVETVILETCSAEVYARSMLGRAYPEIF